MRLGKTLSVLFLLTLAAAPGFAKDKDTFIYGINGDPGNAINTVTTSDRWGLSEVKLLFSPLFMYNGPTSKVYFLAESVTPSKDFKTFTAKLRKGIKWHDEVPFTADDVVFSYEQQLKESNGSWAYGQLIFDGKPVTVKKVDDYTVTFTFPVLTAAAEEDIADIFILPKHIYEGEKDIGTSPKNAHPIGTGPYKFKDYKAGETISFEANPDYFLGAPKIKNIVFRVIGDPNSALLALQNGEIDAVADVTPVDAHKLKANKNLAVYPFDEGLIYHLAFNLNRPAAQNKAIRQAVSYTVDRDELVKAVYQSHEFAEPSYSFLPRANPDHADDLGKTADGVAKAKAVLAKAGLHDVKLVVAYVTGNKISTVVSQILQQQLKAAGIDVELKVVDHAALFKQLQANKGDFDAYLNGYIMGINASTFSPLFTTGSDFNTIHLADKGLDALFDQGSVETDLVKQKAIYGKIQHWLTDDASFVPLIEPKRILVTNSALAGIQEASLVPVYTFEDASKLYFR